MDDFDRAGIKIKVLCIVFGILMFWLGSMYGSYHVMKRWHEDCINRGVAEYNKTTGEWQWKPEYRRTVVDLEDVGNRGKMVIPK